MARSGDSARVPAPRPAAPPPVSEQIVAGALAATIACVWDAVRALHEVEAAERSVRNELVGSLHLLAFVLAPGLLVGVFVGVVLAAVRHARWLTPVRMAIGRPRAWIRRDPDRVAAVVAGLAATTGFVWATARLVRVLPDQLASDRFVPLGVALGAVAVALVALVVAALLTVLLRPLAAALGRLATLATVAIVLAAAGGALAWWRWDLVEPLVTGQVGRRVLAAPVALAAYLGAALVVRLVASRLTSAAPLRWAAATATVVAIGGLVTSALTYGLLQGPRELVESRTTYGARLLGLYVRVTDRDGDGYSAAFGGGDCDDSRADVHPGARDRTGDGVDADCFAGDGSPLVDVLGDGAYGPVPAALGRPNLLLVTVDALRADAVGAYGARRPTPNLDRLAGKSVRFDPVIAPSSRTVSAMPAMMTGLYPSQIARGPEYFYPAFLPENVTVTETLAAHGYRTAAVAGTNFFSRVPGYFQGFQTVDQVETEHAARSWPVDRAIERMGELAGGEPPWFLWVHLFNVHAEYLRDGAPSRYGNGLRDRYDTEVAFADQEIGRLITALDARSLADRTVVVVTSDHGEAMGEHGTRYHEYVYEEELRVPMMVRAPGFRPGLVRRETSTIDIAPTLLNFAGLRPEHRMAARSLVPLLHRARPLPRNAPIEPSDRYLLSERHPDGWMPIHAMVLRRNQVRLTWWVETGRLELHDLSTDPGQFVNLVDDRPAVAHEMYGLLRAWAWQTGDSRNLTESIIAENKLPRPPMHMTHPLNTRYSFFTLLGYDLPRTHYRRGEVIEFTFYYRVDRRFDRDARFLLDFVLPPGVPEVYFFDAEHVPLQARYPTTRWQPGEILRDKVYVPIPAFLPGNLRVRARMLVGAEGVVVPYEGDPNGTGWLPLPELEIE